MKEVKPCQGSGKRLVWDGESCYTCFHCMRTFDSADLKLQKEGFVYPQHYAFVETTSIMEINVAKPGKKCEGSLTLAEPDRIQADRNGLYHCEICNKFFKFIDLEIYMHRGYFPEHVIFEPAQSQEEKMGTEDDFNADDARRLTQESLTAIINPKDILARIRTACQNGQSLIVIQMSEYQSVVRNSAAKQIIEFATSRKFSAKRESGDGRESYDYIQISWSHS